MRKAEESGWIGAVNTDPTAVVQTVVQAAVQNKLNNHLLNLPRRLGRALNLTCRLGRSIFDISDVFESELRPDRRKFILEPNFSLV